MSLIVTDALNDRENGLIGDAHVEKSGRALSGSDATTANVTRDIESLIPCKHWYLVNGTFGGLRQLWQMNALNKVLIEKRAKELKFGMD